MISSPTEEEFTVLEQEGNSRDGKLPKKASSTSTAGLRSKDPRIVSVSRAFGGKDRHSKVCTIRGLRDRRVRLSVPTAIQLYDLQDRLGLNQPSKVVDWLLNAAKDEIDELPPLPISPSTFALNHYQSVLIPQEACNFGFQADERIRINDNDRLNGSKFFEPEIFGRNKSKEVARERVDEKSYWREILSEDQKRVISSNREKTFSNDNSMSFGDFNLEPTTHYQFSSLLGSHGFISQTEEDHLHDINFMSLPPSTLSLSTRSQLLVCPSSLEIDPRQSNHS